MARSINELEAVNVINALHTFLIDVTDDMRKFWPMEAHVLIALQKFYSALEIRISKSSKGQTLIHPLSQEAVFVISNLRSLSGKPITFLQMDARPFLLTAILCKVPHALTEELIEEFVPQISKAIRMTCWSPQLQETVPTMSVKIIWEGETILYKVPIGFLGKFDTRPSFPSRASVSAA